MEMWKTGASVVRTSFGTYAVVLNRRQHISTSTFFYSAAGGSPSAARRLDLLFQGIERTTGGEKNWIAERIWRGLASPWPISLAKAAVPEAVSKSRATMKRSP